LSSAAGSIGSSGGDIAGSWSCRAEELQNAYRDGQLKFFGEHAGLSDPTAFADWLAPLRQCEWVVYAKRPFTGPKAVLAYLSRYTHRVAISNSRLIACDESGVTFRWKDSRAHGRTRYKTMTLSTDEFMRRFLLHVLPSGFHRIRHYGLLANANRKAISRRRVKCFISRRTRVPLTTLRLSPATPPSGPRSSAGTAVPRCSSSRPSHALSTFEDLRGHPAQHER